MSKVESALGIQRQFSPQPKDVYQKQLLVAQGDTTAGKGSKAARLANVLGILSDTMLGEMGRQNTRDKKWGFFMADKIMKDPKAQKYFTTTQQLLATTGHEELLDNPYTMAILDKWRGENAARDIRNRYQEDVVAKEGSCKTRLEEQERWVNYFQSKAKEYNISTDYQKAVDKANTDPDSSSPNDAASIGTIKPISSFNRANDPKFFNMGLYGNFEAYTQNELNRQSEDAAKNRKAIRVGSVTARLSDLSSPEYLSSHSDEEQIADLQNITMEQSASGATLDETLPLLAQYVDNRIASVGSTGLENIFKAKVFTGVDGTEYALGNLIGYEEAHGAAIQMDMARREKYTADITNELSKCTTIEDYDKTVEELKNSSDPLTQHTVAIMAKRNMFNGMREDLQRNIEYQNRLKARGSYGATGQSIKQYYMNAFLKNGDSWYAALSNNNSWQGGNPITAKLKMPGVDKDGNLIERDATAEELTALGTHILQGIFTKLSRGDITLEDAVSQESRLLVAPQMKEFRNSIKDAMENTLAQVSKIDWDKQEYNMANLQNVQMAIDIYSANPAYASMIYGDQISSSLDAITALADVGDVLSYHNPGEVSDGLKTALKYYGGAYLKLQSDKDEIDAKYNAVNTEDNRMITIDSCSINEGDESPETRTFDFSESDYLSNRIHHTAEVLIANGMSADNAMQTAIKKVKGSAYTFASMTFPKDMCVNIAQPDKWKGVCAKKAICQIVFEMGGEKAVDWNYSYKDRQFVFMNSSTNEYRTYDADKFATSANAYYDKYKENYPYEDSGKSTNDDDYEDNPTEELTSATTSWGRNVSE